MKSGAKPLAKPARAERSARGSTQKRTTKITFALLVLCWAALPFTAGSVIVDGLAGRSDSVRALAEAGAWLMWAAALLSALVAHPLALTTLRIVTPTNAAITGWWSVTGSSADTTRTLGVALSAVSVLVAFLAATGDRHINGPAYPNEKRFLLRPPGLLLLGPVPLAWLMAVIGVWAGPLLLAAHAWIAGIVALFVGVPAAALGARSLHALAERFAVFVPAGFVLHDLMTLRDPILFPKNSVEALRLAEAQSDSLDLTQRSLGYAIEVVLREKAELTLLKSGGRQQETGGSARFLIAPTSPGRLLAEAGSRRYSR